VIDTVILIRPRIAVCIKVQKAERCTMLPRMRFEQRIGNEMIAPQGQQTRPLVNDLERVLLDRRGNLFWLAVIEKTVTNIGDGQFVEGIKFHAVRLFPRHDC
jgi:hypothetical protein